MHPMKIDLLSPESFAAGHPFAQYRWLRENAPVFWHEEPDGAGFWADVLTFAGCGRTRKRLTSKAVCHV